ncbi:MAG TPA: GNAT family N-acetyltransferase [Actinomycetota bacterium]
MTNVVRRSSAELEPRQLASLRRLFEDAWPEEEGFTEDDWDHAFGGVHFLVEEDDRVVSHASVVERELHVGPFPLVSGYVEAVATAPDRQGHGLGTAVMRAVGDHVDRSFELGALGTDRFAFYGRLGWFVWAGPLAVRTADGLRATPEENGFVLVRITPTSPPLDLTAPLSCEWRAGDVW